MFNIHEQQDLLFSRHDECSKKKIKNFGQVFKERVIRQLDHDLRITERQEINFRKELGDVVLSKSNNDKKIIGTINHHIENLTYNNYGGEIQNWDEINVTGILNDFPLGQS